MKSNLSKPYIRNARVRSSLSFTYPSCPDNNCSTSNDLLNSPTTIKKALHSPSPRINQIKKEEGMEEINHERSIHFDLSLTNTWEDLVLDDCLPCKKSKTSKLLSPLGISIPSNSNTNDPCDSDSSEILKSPFGLKVNNLVPSVNPRNLQKCFKNISSPISKSTRRSVSPIVVLRPSCLNFKRKYESDTDSGTCSPPCSFKRTNTPLQLLSSPVSSTTSNNGIFSAHESQQPSSGTNNFFSSVFTPPPSCYNFVDDPSRSVTGSGYLFDPYAPSTSKLVTVPPPSNISLSAEDLSLFSRRQNSPSSQVSRAGDMMRLEYNVEPVVKCLPHSNSSNNTPTFCSKNSSEGSSSFDDTLSSYHPYDSADNKKALSVDCHFNQTSLPSSIMSPPTFNSIKHIRAFSVSTQSQCSETESIYESRCCSSFKKSPSLHTRRFSSLTPYSKNYLLQYRKSISPFSKRMTGSMNNIDTSPLVDKLTPVHSIASLRAKSLISPLSFHGPLVGSNNNIPFASHNLEYGDKKIQNPPTLDSTGPTDEKFKPNSESTINDDNMII